MAQAMASMTGLCGSLQIGGSSRLLCPGGGGRAAAAGRPGAAVVRAQQPQAAEIEEAAAAQISRRAALGLVAAGLAGGSFVKAVLADAKPIKLGPPPPPSGGLPGTENSDQARDFELPLKERFFLQPLPPAEAAARAKESAKEILGVKADIDKKAWPYVMNDLRNKAGYLRYDLNTVIGAKPKEEKKALKELTSKLFATIDGVIKFLLISFLTLVMDRDNTSYLLGPVFVVGSLTMPQRSRAAQRQRSTTRRPNPCWTKSFPS
ncbi:putative oxygen-evolving enhancer protein 3, chloroplastic [Iris pallida]|uniref:Oxygen-evolving enhancer protein 3, chloroplastic n=1 Tax=Iris pallida TaxID=29817 RepID=A0AAX6E0H6_IRIPA|nr:putative oxygen-evolving enhancer protein 3, chloroplastic [Iris pallida]KAJ6797568.1 putative oxygen-evolving enhancer protein 3, chloroplastic [Iris pallida]